MDARRRDRQPRPRMAGKGHFRPERIAALMVLALALVLFQWLAAGLDPRHTVQATLAPHPDGPEYLDGAVHLFHEGLFAIHVAGESRPSRYPHGYSLLQAAALVLGSEAVQAPYQVNKWAGWAVLLSLLAWTAWRCSLMTGALAALLLAVQPSFVILCRAPMSEVSAMLPILWGVFLLYGFARGGSWATAAAGGLLLGLAMHFRLSAGLMAGFVAAALWARWRRDQQFPWWGLVASGGGLAIAVLPLALYQHLTLGAPWKTGYGYWLASGGTPGGLFSLANLWPNLRMLWLEAVQLEHDPSTAFLLGEGSYFGPAGMLLLALALALQMKRPEARAFALAGAFFLLGQLFYAHALGRLYFPLVVLAIPAAASFLTGALPRLWRERRWLRLVPLCLLVAAVLAGWPGKRSDSEIGDLWRSHPLGTYPLEFEAALQIRAQTRAPSLLLTDMNPPYLHAMLKGASPSAPRARSGENRRREDLPAEYGTAQVQAGEGLPAEVSSTLGTDPWTAPLLDAHQYRFNPASFSFAGPQRQALVEKALAQSRQVWAVTALHPVKSVAEALPAPSGYRWKVVWTNRVQGGLAQLESREDQDPER